MEPGMIHTAQPSPMDVSETPSKTGPPIEPGAAEISALAGVPFSQLVDQCRAHFSDLDPYHRNRENHAKTRRLGFAALSEVLRRSTVEGSSDELGSLAVVVAPFVTQFTARECAALQTHLASLGAHLAVAADPIATQLARVAEHDAMCRAPFTDLLQRCTEDLERLQPPESSVREEPFAVSVHIVFRAARQTAMHCVSADESNS